MRTPELNQFLCESLSRDRLDKYLSISNDLDSALQLYERNMRLSEAFYTPLQCLEVCLRNNLQKQLETVYGNDWYKNGVPDFQGFAETKIREAIADVSDKNGNYCVGSLVAELSFGFWVGILGPAYDATLWRQSLTKAFSEHNRNMKRSKVHGRLNALRRFRNRVAHHEPIFTKDLKATHNEIIQTIEWMCPETAKWTLHHSRVEAVLNEA